MYFPVLSGTMAFLILVVIINSINVVHRNAAAHAVHLLAGACWIQLGVRYLVYSILFIAPAFGLALGLLDLSMQELLSVPWWVYLLLILPWVLVISALQMLILSRQNPLQVLRRER